MIIRHYKGYVEMEKIREMSKTTRQGTKAYYIVEFLNEIGFNAYGVKTDINFLLKNVNFPMIANVTINNAYKHYIVIYKVNKFKKTMVIADPASRIKTISFSEFETMWNNILIIMYPIKTIVHEKNNQAVKYLKNYIIQNKTTIISLLILSFSLIILSVLCSFFFKFIIDRTSELLKILFIFIFIYCLKIFTDYFRNKVLINLNQKLDLSITFDTFKDVILLPYHIYRNKTTGDIVSRMNELSKIKTTISKIILTLFMDLPLTLVTGVILLIINYKLFLYSLILLLIFIVIIYIFKNPLKNYIFSLQNQNANVTSYMVEAISGFETVKANSLEDKTIEKFKNKYINSLKYSYKLENLYNLEYLLKELVYDIGLLFIIYFGMLEVNSGNMTLGLLITYNSLLAFFFEPIRNIIDLDYEVRESYSAYKRVISLKNKEEKSGIYEKIDGDIIINKLCYKSNDISIINNMTLNIKKNSKVMIMGKSGEGKSTLLKIIMKYYSVPRKMVLIGNIDINDYTKKAIKENIAYVSQNEILFTDTLYNNIMINKENKFKDITNICYIDDILKGNNNYNYLIEENGFNISGGEKQRIVLARALMKKFNILIIDEGLSEVDIDLERKILKNLFTYFKNKTIIVVSHRKDNADLFDSLITLEGGEVNEYRKN